MDHDRQTPGGHSDEVQIRDAEGPSESWEERHADCFGDCCFGFSRRCRPLDRCPHCGLLPLVGFEPIPQQQLAMLAWHVRLLHSSPGELQRGQSYPIQRSWFSFFLCFLPTCYYPTRQTKQQQALSTKNFCVYIDPHDLFWWQKSTDWYDSRQSCRVVLV